MRERAIGGKKAAVPEDPGSLLVGVNESLEISMPTSSYLTFGGGEG